MPISTTLDHISIVTDDFEASRPVYDAVLGAVGLSPVVDYVDPEAEDGDPGTVAAIGYGTGGMPPRVVLAAGLTPTTGAHFAVAVTDRALVGAAERAAGLVAGARVVQQARRWEERQLGYYGMQVADARDNIIEVLYRR
jgi:catechol 2,3-dioxygenase-like lactoylglutathione lyase family enzyme